MKELNGERLGSLPSKKENGLKTGVRLAQEGDVQSILLLNIQFSLPYLKSRSMSEEWIKDHISQRNYFIMIQDEQIAGAMCLTPESNALRIEMLATQNDPHNQEVCKKLVRFAKHETLRRNLIQIKVSTFFNHSIEAFYYENGFRGEKEAIEYSEGKPYWNLIWKGDDFPAK